MRRAALAVIAVVIAGCGGGGGTASGPPTSTPTNPDTPAKLPRGWKLHVNGAGGFSVGVPRGWSAKLSGSTSQLIAPGRVVAVSIAADRTDEALALPPADFAQQTVKALPGFRGIKPASPKATPTRYPGVVLFTEGRRSNGKRERLTLIVLHPEGVAVFSVLGASAAKLKAKPERQLIERISTTLRYRPVSG